MFGSVESGIRGSQDDERLVIFSAEKESNTDVLITAFVFSISSDCGHCENYNSNPNNFAAYYLCCDDGDIYSSVSLFHVLLTARVSTKYQQSSNSLSLVQCCE